MLQFVARTAGARAEVAPIKSYLRVCEKLVLDYDGDVSRVTDLVRSVRFLSICLIEFTNHIL